MEEEKAEFEAYPYYQFGCFKTIVMSLGGMVGTVGLGVGSVIVAYHLGMEDGSLGVGIGVMLVIVVWMLVYALKYAPARMKKMSEKWPPISVKNGWLFVPDQRLRHEEFDLGREFTLRRGYTTTGDVATGQPSKSYRTGLVVEQDGRRVQVYSQEMVGRRALIKWGFLAKGTERVEDDWLMKDDCKLDRQVSLEEVVKLYRVLRGKSAARLIEDGPTDGNE